MSEHKCPGCDEYQGLTRRNFVGLATGVAAAALAPAWLPRVVYADSHDGSRDVIVSIFLRGGGDALTLCVPHGEDSYYDLRPTLAVPRPDGGGAGRAIDLDGFFGFPQGMKPLMDAWRDGNLLVVHACGMPNPTRSHFDAMRFMEVGMGDAPPNLQTGWLGRHLQATAPTVADGVLRAVGIGYGLQRTLVGGPLTLPIADLAEFGFDGRRATRKERRQALEEMYGVVGDPLATSAENTFRTVDLLKKIGFKSYKPAGAAAYPDDEFGYALKSTAALVKAEVGVEAVAIDLGGWDTHDFQGPVDGHMAYLMESLSGGLAAFHRDLFSDGFEEVVVTTTSEFGRNAAENASAGTDHGHGGLMLVLGGHVAGGRVLAEWPGLADGQLYEGQDLAITIDYRDVLTEILTRRLGNPDFRTVFTDPGYEPQERGVIL